MGRPWEYSRWRRVLMQVLMWVVLAGTLGLAQLISHQRAFTLAPSNEAVELGPVMVRPPEGWVETKNSDAQQGVLQYIAPDRSVLTVSVERLPPGDRGADELAQMPGEEDRRPLEFNGLSDKGFVATVPIGASDDDNIASEQRLLLAWVVLPEHDVLKIALVPPDQIRPQDRSLIRRVARETTWSDDRSAPQTPGDPENNDQ